MTREGNDDMDGQQARLLAKDGHVDGKGGEEKTSEAVDGEKKDKVDQEEEW